jgi:GNAT superfamily N-acetyltransferase
MIELAAQKRAEYAQAQTVFWRVAADAAERQTAFFESLLARDGVVALVHESSGVIDGFVIAFLHDAPPVYDPGGPTCTIDDFTVATPDLWPSVGRDLLLAATEAVKELGAVQVIVVCGHHDEPKRAMLQAAGWPVASEWRVRAL